MKFCRQIILMTVVLSFVACSQTGLVSGVKVKLVKPEKVLSMTADTTFGCTFDEVLNCYTLQIVNDTILVFMEQTSGANLYHFKAYSTNSYAYLGAFISKGRGPGEMVSPHLVSTDAYKECISVNDNQSEKAYIVNVEESITNRRTSVVASFDLPSNVIDWMPLPGGQQFTLELENREMVYHLRDSAGLDVYNYNLYSGIDSERYVTHLSAILTSDCASEKVAEVMLMFPQINFIETDSGKIHSVAVDKSYRGWKSVLDKMLDFDSIEYYTAANSASDLLFAVYKGQPIRVKDYTSSIHIFDWNGNFLYEINVEESLTNLAFDSRTGYLYAVAKPDNRIVRYDLGFLLNGNTD